MKKHVCPNLETACDDCKFEFSDERKMEVIENSNVIEKLKSLPSLFRFKRKQQNTLPLNRYEKNNKQRKA